MVKWLYVIGLRNNHHPSSRLGNGENSIELPRGHGHAVPKNAGSRKETWLVRVLSLRPSVNEVLCTPCVLLEWAQCFEWNWVFVHGQKIETRILSLYNKLRDDVKLIWHPHLRKNLRVLDVPTLVTSFLGVWSHVVFVSIHE